MSAIQMMQSQLWLMGYRGSTGDFGNAITGEDDGAFMEVLQQYMDNTGISSQPFFQGGIAIPEEGTDPADMSAAEERFVALENQINDDFMESGQAQATLLSIAENPSFLEGNETATQAVQTALGVPVTGEYDEATREALLEFKEAGELPEVEVDEGPQAQPLQVSAGSGAQPDNDQDLQTISQDKVAEVVEQHYGGDWDAYQDDVTQHMNTIRNTEPSDMDNEDVAAAQEFLNLHGYNLAVDGLYGPNTGGAMEGFIQSQPLQNYEPGQDAGQEAASKNYTEEQALEHADAIEAQLWKNYNEEDTNPWELQGIEIQTENGLVEFQARILTGSNELALFTPDGERIEIEDAQPGQDAGADQDADEITPSTEYTEEQALENAEAIKAKLYDSENPYVKQDVTIETEDGNLITFQARATSGFVQDLVLFTPDGERIEMPGEEPGQDSESIYANVVEEHYGGDQDAYRADVEQHTALLDKDPQDMTNEEVARAQEFLNLHGHGLTVDGLYGTNTIGALRSFENGYTSREAEAGKDAEADQDADEATPSTEYTEEQALENAEAIKAKLYDSENPYVKQDVTIKTEDGSLITFQARVTSGFDQDLVLFTPEGELIDMPEEQPAQEAGAEQEAAAGQEAGREAVEGLPWKDDESDGDTQSQQEAEAEEVTPATTYTADQAIANADAIEAALRATGNEFQQQGVTIETQDGSLITFQARIMSNWDQDLALYTPDGERIEMPDEQPAQEAGAEQEAEAGQEAGREAVEGLPWKDGQAAEAAQDDATNGRMSAGEALDNMAEDAGRLFDAIFGDGEDDGYEAAADEYDGVGNPAPVEPVETRELGAQQATASEIVVDGVGPTFASTSAQVAGEGYDFARPVEQQMAQAAQNGAAAEGADLKNPADRDHGDRSVDRQQQPGMGMDA